MCLLHTQLFYFRSFLETLYFGVKYLTLKHSKSDDLNWFSLENGDN